MILLVDIGNTLTKIAIGNEKNQKVSQIKAVVTKNNNYVVEIKKEFAKIKTKLEQAIISCVVPEKLAIITELIAIHFKIEAIVINYQLIKLLPITINLDHQKKLGSDLIALAVASHNQYGNSITIGLGTATTYTIVKDNDLKGVIIAPGFTSAKTSLSNEATLIKPFKVTPYKSLLGTTTNHALSIGYGNGFNYMIEGTIEAINKELKANLTTIIAGGNFQELKPFLKFKYHYQENLLMLGLIIIYQILKKNNKLKIIN